MEQLELKVPPLVLVIIAVGLMVPLALYLPQSEWLQSAGGWLGTLFIVAGGLVAISGVWAFRRSQTTVNPMSPDTVSELVTSGIYRYTRNPMYLGFLLTLIGASCWLASIYTLIPCVLFVRYMTTFQIKPEERALEQLFPHSFPEYKQQVRRWL
ncbi:isoprenylcysteine carboxylmethyltransferase family protein [Photobacterium sanctipauli]|uniref:Isoprenylcysteine carboxylmethyltransferase family protein n=1 Tax=Photobacterium sanctipauli TaxID=1342794 RepID=A0A2T3NIA2_9GAMM|nr:isoprenylcysteine carboxylmethyltransferase family protein [Photobacterium sanctipauli]PSW14734.1 isoprenylcysteine carboxylmethyltransferase family protein [Photobacterium sanctipauli]